MRVRKKLNVFVFLAAGLASFFAITLLLSVLFYFFKSSVHQSFKSQTYATLNELDRLITDRAKDVEIIAQTLDRRVKPQDDELIEARLFSIRDSAKAFQNLMYVDNNFVKHADTNKMSLGKKIQSNLLEKASLDSQVVFDFIEDPETQTKGISFAKQILDTGGRKAGYLIAQVPFATVARILSQNDLKQEKAFHAKVDLIRGNGEIFFSTYRIQEKDTQLLALVRNYLRPKENFQFLSQEGQLYSFGRGHEFLGLANLDWYLVMSASESEVYRPVRQLGIFLAAAFLFFGFILWKLIAKSSAYFVKPLEQASSEVKRLGQGDWDALQNLAPPEDEVGDLILSLQTMSQEIKQLLSQRAHSAKMIVLGEVASNIAHEINNPLQVISLQLELIRKLSQHQTKNPEVENSIRVALETVFRISGIIKALRALSRQSPGDPFLSARASELVEDAVVLSQGSLRRHVIELTQVNSDPTLTLECRAVEITQILLNLISNARDAIQHEKERWIEIRTEKEGEFVLFKVRNSGPRISEQILDRIFDPLFTTKQPGEGTGLGLSVSQKLAFNHGGSIFVDLQDQQTCFVLKLRQNPALAIGAQASGPSSL